MDQARRDAFRAGLKPAEFWASTPYDTREWCRQHAERETSGYKLGTYIAWHCALYARQKRLPELATIMKRFDTPAPVKPQSAAALLDKVRILNAAFGGKEIRHG